MSLLVKNTSSGREYKVKDLGLSQADFCRLEIELAEVEMPGLMACRTEFGPSQRFKGARISGSLHMTIQTTVLIETLTALGAAAIARDSAAVFAWKGETLQEDWWCAANRLDWGPAGRPRTHRRRWRQRHPPHPRGRQGRGGVLEDGEGAGPCLHRQRRVPDRAGAHPRRPQDDGEARRCLRGDHHRRQRGCTKCRPLAPPQAAASFATGCEGQAEKRWREEGGGRREEGEGEDGRPLGREKKNIRKIREEEEGEEKNQKKKKKRRSTCLMICLEVHKAV